MPITVGNVSDSGEKTATPFSWSHNNNGDFLIVGVNVRDFSDTISSVTYAATSMTELREDGGVDGFRARTAIYYLVNPASGANTVEVTLSGAPEDASAGAISMSGVDQTTPVDVAGGAGTTGTSEAASQAITPVTDGAWTMAAMTLSIDRTTTIGAAQTERWAIG